MKESAMVYYTERINIESVKEFIDILMSKESKTIICSLKDCLVFIINPYSWRFENCISVVVNENDKMIEYHQEPNIKGIEKMYDVMMSKDYEIYEAIGADTTKIIYM